MSPFGHLIITYDKERTVLDIIRDKKRVDAQVFREVIRSYFFSNDINLLKLSKYAVELDMEDELRQYTEVML